VNIPEQWLQRLPTRGEVGRLFDVANPALRQRLVRDWGNHALATAVNWPEGQLVHVSLGGFSTLHYLVPHITTAALADGFIPRITVGDYNQLYQDLMRPESSVIGSGVDLFWVWADLMDLLSAEFRCDPVGWYSESGQRAVNEAVTSFTEALAAARLRSRAFFLINEFVPARRPPLGIADGTRFPNFESLYRRANDRLSEAVANLPSTAVFPLAYYLRRFGFSRASDPRLEILADCRFAAEFLADVAEGLRPYLRSLKGAVRKVLALDLDNTLWDGIVGEDGADGVRIGSGPRGIAFQQFQKAILELYQRGVILAINSKNNLSDVEKVFTSRPEMILRLDHFASVQVNWSDKAGNCRRIAEEINVGLDSLVFWDDNPAERALVRDTLEDVYVVDVPSDPSFWANRLRELTLFDSLNLTAEDSERGRMYAADRQRREAAVGATDLAGFLKSLRLTITVESCHERNVDRIVSLLGRTNQFNLTTRRHSEQVIREWAERNKTSVLCYAAEDRFGSYGIIGVSIVNREASAAVIDSFLLSCRALGKGVETVMLAFVVQQARHWGCKELKGRFLPTKKNTPAKDFLPMHGFIRSSHSGTEEQDYVFDLGAKDIAIPEYVQIRTEDLPSGGVSWSTSGNE
jgi:FkbH-like protein